ncbi:hypothetical protein EYF80_001875 [Liparis tanakae]|uniref:Uncharacterized protein n=1 Tax=Liparis tanakae TaxID=230148 RepID=A0A4Z2JD21_9TELE|nr:hypothetical protein EYF80_001875 [Liparis tanakae]
MHSNSERTRPNHLMNTDEHHSSEQDSQINQRPSAFSPLIIPAKRSLGKPTGALAQWTVPAVTHEGAPLIGYHGCQANPFRGA